jgi:hypothetical protein
MTLADDLHDLRTAGAAGGGDRVLAQPTPGEWCLGVFLGYAEHLRTWTDDAGQSHEARTSTARLASVETADGAGDPHAVRLLHLDYKVLRIELRDPALPEAEAVPAPGNPAPQPGSLVYVECTGERTNASGRGTYKAFRVKVADPTPDSTALVSAVEVQDSPPAGRAALAGGAMPSDDIPFRAWEV